MYSPRRAGESFPQENGKRTFEAVRIVPLGRILTKTTTDYGTYTDMRLAIPSLRPVSEPGEAIWLPPPRYSLLTLEYFFTSGMRP